MDDSRVAEIVAKARDNERLMDGTSRPIERIVDGTDLVLGVWPDPCEPFGVAWRIIKGHRLVQPAIHNRPSVPAVSEILTLASVSMTWDAISFKNSEHAVAAQLVVVSPDGC